MINFLLMSSMKIVETLLIGFLIASVNKVYAEELETWICHDESNLYKVVIDNKTLTYNYLDDFYNKNLERELQIQTTDESGKIFASTPLIATPAAEKGSCVFFW